MKMQIHHKQIVVLTLAVVLAILSFWIPLPPEPQTTRSASSKAAVKSAFKPSVVFAREPFTIKRFPVTVKIPQTVIYPDSIVAWVGENPQLFKNIIELWEFSNDEINQTNRLKIIPIIDNQRNLKY